MLAIGDDDAAMSVRNSCSEGNGRTALTRLLCVSASFILDTATIDRRTARGALLKQLAAQLASDRQT